MTRDPDIVDTQRIAMEIADRVALERRCDGLMMRCDLLELGVSTNRNRAWWAIGMACAALVVSVGALITMLVLHRVSL